MSIDKKATLEIEKIQSEIEKTTLEKEKIRLENTELKRVFWKKPQWFASAITAFVTLVSSTFLICNGNFDKRYQQYKAEKATLEKEKVFLKFDILQFQGQKKSIESDIKKMKDSLLHLGDSLNIKNSSLAQLQKNRNELDRVINRLRDNLSNKDVEVFKILSDKQNYEAIMKDSIVRLQNRFDIELKKSWVHLQITTNNLQVAEGKNHKYAIKLKELEDKLKISNK
jgi:uncharacterized protein (DUF3084 family)